MVSYLAVLKVKSVADTLCWQEEHHTAYVRMFVNVFPKCRTIREKYRRMYIETTHYVNRLLHCRKMVKH